MGEEISKGVGFEYRFEDSDWINNIVKKQPPAIQDAYINAVRTAISSIDLSKDITVSRTVKIEDAKSLLLTEFDNQLSLLEKRGLIPVSYEKDIFENKLKTWVALADEYRLIDASLGYEFLIASPKTEEVEDWRLGPSLRKKFAEALYKIDPTTREAFFLGNNITKQFSDDAIEEIKMEIERLGAK